MQKKGLASILFDLAKIFNGLRMPTILPLYCVVLIAVLNGNEFMHSRASDILFKLNAFCFNIASWPEKVLQKSAPAMGVICQDQEVLNNKLLQAEALLLDLQVQNAELMANLQNIKTLRVPKDRLSVAKTYNTSIDGSAHTIIAYAGIDDGVNQSAYVIANNGLLGKVVSVTRGMAKVKLITGLSQKTPVIFNKSRAKAILMGEAEGKLEVMFLEGSTFVEQDEIAITSGDGGIYPPGIPVGKLIKQDDTIHVLPFFKLHAIESVLISYQPEEGR